MPYNPTVCNSRECHITGYDVVVEAGAVAGTIQLSLVNTCNTLHDNCRAKAILVSTYQDYLENNAVTASPKADCLYNDKCPGGGPGMAFYNATYTLVVDPAVNTPGATVPVPAAAVTVNYPLPKDCSVNVFA